MECVDPLNPRPQLLVSTLCLRHNTQLTSLSLSLSLSVCLCVSHVQKGRLQTRVHVGCPPGLSLVFDHVATQARDNQFCTTTNNISCYYFGNGTHTITILATVSFL